MLLFRSEGHVDNWCSQSQTARGPIMSLDQQWRLAVIWYEHRLSRDYRRFTVEEAREIFTGLGLTGPFWALR